MDILENDIRFLKTVGEVKAQKLNKLGIYKYRDLLEHFPRAYEDRRNIKKIKDIIPGESVIFTGKIIGNFTVRRIRKSLNLISFYVTDDTERIRVTIFNQAYMKDKLVIGNTYAIYGRVEFENLGLEIANPVMFEVEKINELKGIYPIYPITNSINSEYIRKLIKEIYKQKFNINEILNKRIRDKYELIEIENALKKIHMPKTMEDVETSRKRLIFEELYVLQLALASLKKDNIKTKRDKEYADIDASKFIASLPFELTNAQIRTINEITSDLKKSTPMNRLVEGDVGSGKTIVAAIGMYLAVKNGYQASMMAPTTILANQHFDGLKPILDKLKVRSAVLTGSTSKKEKNKIIEELKSGAIDILFGTHAILEDSIEFKKLSFVVTDEQHRFGVKQRLKLSSKNKSVDCLVMTATPIPRTLALLLYSDLDMSIIDELPKGRKPVKTYAVDESYETRIETFIKKELDLGHQAYVVCPLIEENEELDLTAAKSLYEKYKNEIFKQYNVGFLNGKMKNKEKDQIMQCFKEGSIDILISTTVIEVGVDVKNATLMIVEDASRFGLSTLHQLRGRVGRSDLDSYCILKTKVKSKEIMERLEIMVKSNNGLEIASKDLELRGPGDFFGTKQHGMLQLKIANLLEDMSLLKLSNEAVKETLKDDPTLSKNENCFLKQKLEKYLNSGLIYS